MVGPVDDEATVTMFAEALPAATITLCRLHAGRDQLTKRIMQRAGRQLVAAGRPVEGPVAYSLAPHRRPGGARG
jgi:hypothetical protein